MDSEPGLDAIDPSAAPDGGWVALAATGSAEIVAADRWRTVRTLGVSGPSTTLPDGRAVVQFAANDYLGLSCHPRVIEAAIDATRRYGAGSGASRVVVGSRPPHDELERRLAEWKHAEAALLFPSGFATNVGVLTSLVRLGRDTGTPVGIVSDELNHASIIDGARLAGAPVTVVPHNDVAAAAAAMADHGAAGRRSIVVTDSVFSMDGDVAPLIALADVTAAAGGLLVVDDAHAVFPGFGADVLAGGAPHLVVGTLSKTLGSVGGFVAGPAALVDWIRNTARTFIFSTASPPSAAAAALAALEVVQSDDGTALVEALRRNVSRFDPAATSAVVPVILGDEQRALEVSAALLERGLLVPAIRPPTVPVGSSRLRIAVSAAHTLDQVDELVVALEELGVELATTAGAR